MKKFILLFTIVVLILASAIGFGQTTHYANQVTILYDAPTTDVDGNPLSQSTIDALFYDVFIREKGGEQVYIGETDLLEYVVTLPTPGLKYDIGVLAKYPVDDDWIYSAIAWSTEEGWDVGFFVPVSPVTNLRIE